MPILHSAHKQNPIEKTENQQNYHQKQEHTLLLQTKEEPGEGTGSSFLRLLSSLGTQEHLSLFYFLTN